MSGFDPDFFEHKMKQIWEESEDCRHRDFGCENEKEDEQDKKHKQRSDMTEYSDQSGWDQFSGQTAGLSLGSPPGNTLEKHEQEGTEDEEKE